MNFSKQFLVDTGERALSTFLQVVLAIVGTDALNLFSMDWKAALATAASAAILSVIKSLAGQKVGNEGTASWSNATLPAPTQADKIVDVLKSAEDLLEQARAGKVDLEELRKKLL